MIYVKTKSQVRLAVQQVRQRTTFQVISRWPRGSTGVITLAVPKAGKIIADGNEIKRAKATARKRGRVTFEVELNPAGQTAVKRYGRIRAHIKLSYTPQGGHAITKTVPLIFGWEQS